MLAVWGDRLVSGTPWCGCGVEGDVAGEKELELLLPVLGIVVLGFVIAAVLDGDRLTFDVGGWDREAR